MDVSLRPVTAADGEFLFQVYADTRREEVAAWGWDGAQQLVFLRMQFTAQRQSHAAAYPDADDSVIVCDGESVGRVVVQRAEDHIRLVDIALLPAHRNRRIGTFLIRALMNESQATGHPLRLHVARANRAVHLYERLGFSHTGGDQMYGRMDWAPSP
jgi:ribosomal protein S18 acetylase RimI-like enzyme